VVTGASRPGVVPARLISRAIPAWIRAARTSGACTPTTAGEEPPGAASLPREIPIMRTYDRIQAAFLPAGRELTQ
jgi:hypothetical protein